MIANNPVHLAGAIDSDGADKAARFMQLCDAFDIPLLFLCDTPGMMVGPEIEKTALVRHVSRMFVTGANLSVPFFTIVLRKGYGLGAQAMAGGSFRVPMFTVSWPTGEFGGMGLEGAVKLGFRKEIAALDDPAKRKALFDQMVARMYEIGKAVNMASNFEIDDVIDPLESRKWIMAGLRSSPAPAPRTGKKRPMHRYMVIVPRRLPSRSPRNRAVRGRGRLSRRFSAPPGSRGVLIVRNRGLVGGGCRLERTALSVKFPEHQRKYREVSRFRANPACPY